MKASVMVGAMLIFCAILLWVMFVITASRTQHLFNCSLRIESEYEGYIFHHILSPDQLLALARQACQYSNEPGAEEDWAGASMASGYCFHTFIEECGDRALIERLVSIVMDKKENGMFRAQALCELEEGSPDPERNLWKQLTSRQLQELMAACYRALADKSEPWEFRAKGADCIARFFHIKNPDEIEKDVEIISAILMDKRESGRLRSEMFQALGWCIEWNPKGGVRNKLRTHLLTLIKDPETPNSLFFQICSFVVDVYDISEVANPSMITILESRIAISTRDEAEIGTRILRKLQQAGNQVRKEEIPKH